MSNCSSRGRKFESKLRRTTSMEIDHEIISADILHLQPIQNRQLSATDLSMFISTHWTTGQSLRGLSLLRKSDSWHDMTLAELTGL